MYIMQNTGINVCTFMRGRPTKTLFVLSTVRVTITPSEVHFWEFNLFGKKIKLRYFKVRCSQLYIYLIYFVILLVNMRSSKVRMLKKPLSRLRTQTSKYHGNSDRISAVKLSTP